MIGFLGWLGMYLFRHKTQHMKFKLGFPLIILLQLGLLAPEGLMMVERDRKTSYPIPPGYQLLRTKEYRNVRIDFIAHTREENI